MVGGVIRLIDRVEDRDLGVFSSIESFNFIRTGMACRGIMLLAVIVARMMMTAVNRLYSPSGIGWIASKERFERAAMDRDNKKKSNPSENTPLSASSTVCMRQICEEADETICLPPLLETRRSE